MWVGVALGQDAKIEKQQTAPATPESAPSRPAAADIKTDDGAKTDKSPAAKVAGMKLDGYFDLRYRLRSSPTGVKDQDVFGSLGLDLTIPNIGKEGLHFRLSGSAILDVNDFPQNGSPFFGLSETFNSRFHSYLYEAFAEANPGGPLSNVRVGRQMLWREEGIRFDGAYLETKRVGPASFTFYGGVPVHFYEASAEGDVVAGTGVKLHASKTLTFTIDEIYMRDRRQIAGLPDRVEELLSVFGAEWHPLKTLTARGSYSMLDTKERRENFSLNYADSDAGFRASGEILRQNDFTDLPATEFSPMVGVLGNYHPYLEGRLNASKTLFKPAELGAGYRIRRLLEGTSEGLFNHEFDQVYAVLTLDPFPIEDVAVSVRGDLFDGNSVNTGGGGVSIEKRFGKTARIEASTDYTLYRLDYILGEERFRSREYALRGKVKLSERISIGAGYRFESDSLGEYHVADFNLIIRF